MNKSAQNIGSEVLGRTTSARRAGGVARLKSAESTVSRFEVPIYRATVWLVSTKKVRDELCKSRWTCLFGDPPEHDGYSGWCLWNHRSTFALVFDRQDVCLELVSHEVFHLTHRILEWSSSNFDEEHHEQGAMLHGFLMTQVVRRLRKAGIPVRPD